MCVCVSAFALLAEYVRQPFLYEIQAAIRAPTCDHLDVKRRPGDSSSLKTIPARSFSPYLLFTVLTVLCYMCSVWNVCLISSLLFIISLHFFHDYFLFSGKNIETGSDLWLSFLCFPPLCTEWQQSHYTGVPHHTHDGFDATSNAKLGDR